MAKVTPVRVSEPSIQQRCAELTARECALHRKIRPMSTVIRTDYSRFDKEIYSKPRTSTRTMLWP